MPASRLLIYDGELREDEDGPLGVFLCEECKTLNAGYGPCPYCTNATECVMVRTVEGHLLTMARPRTTDESHLAGRHFGYSSEGTRPCPNRRRVSMSSRCVRRNRSDRATRSSASSSSLGISRAIGEAVPKAGRLRMFGPAPDAVVGIFRVF
jgi:hypothetical protein